MQKKLFSFLFFTLCIGTFSKLNAQCQAGFTVSDTSGTYYFADSSSAPGDTISSWSWDFGDATTSVAQNPNHVYASCGMYSVTMTISTLHGCSKTFVDTLYVPGQISGSYVFSVDTMTGNTSFIASPYSANYSYSWDFGDTSGTTGDSVSHTYVNGTYNACVIVSDNNNACTSDTVCQNVAVNIYTPVPCQAGFTFTQSADSLRFTDASTAPGDTIIIWNWDFGDGATSGQQSPTHIYSSCGMYVVSLFIQTSGSCGSFFSDTINVSTPLNGSYTFNVDTTNGNTQFVTAPSNPTYSYAWDFGDSTNGSGANPTHTYVNGTYNACVIISDTNHVCVADTVCNSITVNIAPPPPCQAGFTFTNAGNVYTFTDTSIAGSGTITNWLWNFGDFTTSSQQNPTHTYASCGRYIVSLTIGTSTFCLNTFKDTIYVSGTISGSFTSFVDTTNGNTQFNASPNNPNYSYAWDFGDGNTGTGNNPTETYANGTYNVCVIISDTTGACMADTVCDSVVVNINTTSACPVTWNNFANGSQQTFTANPFGFGNTYVWDFGDSTTGNGFITNHTYAAAGTYTVCLTMATAGGCVSMFCDTVNIPPPLPCSINFTWAGTAGNETFTATTVNGGPFPVVAWIFGDGANGIGNPTTHLYTTNGLMLVCAVLNPGGFTGCSDTLCHLLLITGAGVGIDEHSFAESIKMFPNPMQDQMTLQFNLSTVEDISVAVYDVVGNKVADVYTMKKQTGAQNILWKTSDISPGIYFVKIRAGEKVITKKIVKE